ncbi:hypothetical protein DFH07DRAFT_951053 [Mycena maculata]|uniref:Uncharacterized protein n=1 Tax=Mycena maculata TaxID=230809 RepID=A0AAD7K450_9AGAR|nr:hypothetical protein DFH07DRAFT_951053 [Mycena maculata]
MSFPKITVRPRKGAMLLLDPDDQLLEVYHPNVSGGFPIVHFRAFPSEPGSNVVGVPLGVVLDACFVVSGNQSGELHLRDMPGGRVAGPEFDQDGCYRRESITLSLFSQEGNWIATTPSALRSRLGHRLSRYPPVGWEARPRRPRIFLAPSTAPSKPPRAEIGSGLVELPPTLRGYGGEPDLDLNSIRNQVALREDLNGQGLDQGLFLFAPYTDAVVAVFVQSAAFDLAHEYHLRALTFPTRIRRGYLFIRFAWNVLKFLSPGLASAANRVRSSEERPDGAGFVKLKRKRGDGSAGGPNKSQKDSGGNRRPEGGGGSRDASSRGSSRGGARRSGTGLDENGESAPTTDEDEAQLAVFETLDAALKTRKLTRLTLEFRRAHPQISAVGDPRVWEGSDDGD